jgi:hypothetical protein
MLAIAFSPPVFPFPETVPNFVCHFKGSLQTFLSGSPMPLFKTRIRVLREEREWSRAKLAQVGAMRQTR